MFVGCFRVLLQLHVWGFLSAGQRVSLMHSAVFF